MLQNLESNSNAIQKVPNNLHLYDMSQGSVIQALINKMGSAVLPSPTLIKLPSNAAPADKTRVVKPIMPIKQ